MNPIAVRYTLLWGAAAAGLAILGVYTYRAELALERSEFITGYSLFAIMLMLALFNARKKLAMIPLMRSAY